MAEEAYNAKLEEVDNYQLKLDGTREVEPATALGDGALQTGKFKRRDKIVTPEKVSAVAFYPKDPNLLLVGHMCASGVQIVFNAKGGGSIRSLLIDVGKWQLTSVFNPSGTKLATGGLDNIVHIWDIPDMSGESDYDPMPYDGNKKHKQFEKHGGYVNQVCWMDDTKFVSASGDYTVMYWDINSSDNMSVKTPDRTAVGHTKDVYALDTRAGDLNTFLSGSGDSYAKLWDMRISENNNFCAMTFSGNKGPVNDVKWMANNNAFATAGADGTIRIFDIRCCRQIMQIGEVAGEEDEDGPNPVTQILFSKSNAMLFGGFENGDVKAFNTRTGEVVTQYSGYHTAEICSMALAPSGEAIAVAARATDHNISVLA